MILGGISRRAGLGCAKAATGENMALCRSRSARRMGVCARRWPKAEIARATMLASRYATLPDFCPFLQSCTLDECRPPCWFSCFLGQYVKNQYHAPRMVEWYSGAPAIGVFLAHHSLDVIFRADENGPKHPTRGRCCMKTSEHLLSGEQWQTAVDHYGLTEYPPQAINQVEHRRLSAVSDFSDDIQKAAGQNCDYFARPLCQRIAANHPGTRYALAKTPTSIRRHGFFPAPLYNRTDTGLGLPRMLPCTYVLNACPPCRMVQGYRCRHAPAKPSYECRKLLVGHFTAFSFSRKAWNQEAVVETFASEGWCEIIESPLRKGLDQKTRTQLRKTVLGLKRPNSLGTRLSAQGIENSAWFKAA
jgi:hypothetical protein